MQGLALERVFRDEGPKVLAALIRSFRDFDLAQEALGDALLRAAERWPRDGLPARPAAWLLTVARRAAVDRIRHQRVSPLLHQDAPDVPTPESDDLEGSSELPDDRLTLLFTCCHPSIAPAAQAALALRTLCGLTTREIARAFLESEATTAQRIVRAKRKILEARIPYQVPGKDQLAERLLGVLDILYLVFNEGYTRTDGADLLGVDLAEEALRLTALLTTWLPEEPDAHGLLALMGLHHARRHGRIVDGRLIPLDSQDRTLWDQAAISRVSARLREVLLLGRVGPYQVQAAIAALHAEAPTAASTDWRQITALYGTLLAIRPGPVVELNAAVALAMAGEPEAALAWLIKLDERPELRDYHLLPAARAELLRRLGRAQAAKDAYLQALARVRQPQERAYLERRLGELEKGGL